VDLPRFNYLKQQLMAVGIEPDDCFYIQNCARMVGRERLDLAIDS